MTTTQITETVPLADEERAYGITFISLAEKALENGELFAVMFGDNILKILEVCRRLATEETPTESDISYKEWHAMLATSAVKAGVLSERYLVVYNVH